MVKESNNRGWIKSIVAFGIPGIYLIIILLTSVISYTTADDVPMMQILAGYTTGAAIGWGRFINPILFKLIAFLYSLLPGIEWYAVIQLFIIILSMGIINFCAFRKLGSEKNNIFLDIILAVLFDSVLYWIIVRMHFYFVSAIIGSAAIAIVLASDFRKANCTNTYSLIFLCFLLCYLWSEETAKSVSCFLGLSLIYRGCLDIVSTAENREEWRNNRRRIFLRIIMLAGTMSVVFVAGSEISKRVSIQTNGQDYREWNNYRISFQDYELPEFDSTQEVYDAAGWDREYYMLVRQFYYLDERIETTHLKKIVEEYTAPSVFSPTRKTVKTENSAEVQSDTKSILEEINDGTQRFHRLLSQEKEAKALYVWIWGLFLSSILLFTRDKKQIIKVIATIFCFCGTLLLTLILSMRGRIPLRAFAVIAIPSHVFMGLNFIDVLKQKKASIIQSFRTWKNQRGQNRSSVCFWKNATICIIAFSVFLYTFCGYTTGNIASLSESNDNYLSELNRESKVYQYARDHKDIVLVCDWASYSPFNPFPYQKKGEITNLITTGGWRYNTYGFRLQLAINGLEKLTSENMADENIYYISRNATTINLMKTFLRNNYNIDQCRLVERTDWFYVLKFYSSERQYSDDFVMKMETLKEF